MEVRGPEYLPCCCNDYRDAKNAVKPARAEAREEVADLYVATTRKLSLLLGGDTLLLSMSAAPWLQPETLQRNGVLIAVIAGGLFYLVGQTIASQPQRAAQFNEGPDITVQGHGSVEVKPDVASIQLGVSEGPVPTAEEVATALADKMNPIMAFLREQNIADKDITTSQLSVNPSYDFTTGGRRLLGYEGQQTLTVKVRNVDGVGPIVSGVAQLGANQIGTPIFTVDEPEALRLQAQEEAAADARQQAEKLAETLGATLGRVKKFDATSSPTQPPYLLREQADAVAVGSGGDVPIAPGETEITAVATVTYEIK